MFSEYLLFVYSQALGHLFGVLLVLYDSREGLLLGISLEYEL